MNLLKPIVVTAATIFLLAWFLPSVNYADWVTLLIASLVLTLLQKIARPVLNILLLPINIVTLGLFSVVINISLLWLATYLVPGFSIDPMVVMGVQLNGFFTLLLVSVLIGFFQSVFGFLL